MSDHAVGVYQQVVLAFITSVVPPKLEPTDLLLDPRDMDFVRTGLKVRSVLRLNRMMTVSAKIILRQLGVLSPNLQAQVQQRLRKLFVL